MRFEARLPDSPATGFIRAAGIDVEGIFDLWYEKFTSKKKTSLPVTFQGEYFPSDPPQKVRVKVLTFEPHTHVEIEVSSAAIGRKIRQVLTRYSVENDGVAVADREHRALWSQINAILRRDRLSYDKLRHREGVLTRRAIESLMKLYDKTGGGHDIYRLFDPYSVPRSERVFVARWLIKIFERERNPDEEIGIPIYELSVPQIADDLVRLIKDKRYRDRRWPLALALARTKDPRAADVIVTLLGQGWNTRGAIEALGRLPAQKYVEKIRKYLRDPDSDVRREAKKTLKKLGYPVETPPLAVHLVKNRRLIPKGLEEWSSNLDMDDLAPTLKKLAGVVDSGFGQPEIAEVVGVAEEMAAEQTKVFQFTIKTKGRRCDLFIVIFMDDIDSPDLEIHTDPQIVRKLESSMPTD